MYGGGLAYNINNGAVYYNFGVSRSYPAPSFIPGVSLFAGKILGNASGEKTDDFLKGVGSGGAAYIPAFRNIIGVGSGVNHSIGGDTSIEFGVGTPGYSISPVGYGDRINLIER